MARKFDNYIDGKWVPSSGETIEVTNPASHDVLALVPDSTLSLIHI